MRKIISFAIAGVMAFVVASCGGSSDLGVIAQLENKKCPVKIPGIGSITSVEYSGDTLRFNCSVSNRALNLASMAEHPEAMKQAVMPLLPDLLKNDDLGNKLLENKAYLSLHYYSKGPKRPKGLSKSVKFPSAADIDVVITPDEIKDIMEGNSRLAQRQACSPDSNGQRPVPHESRFGNHLGIGSSRGQLTHLCLLH